MCVCYLNCFKVVCVALLLNTSGWTKEGSMKQIMDVMRISKIDNNRIKTKRKDSRKIEIRSIYCLCSINEWYSFTLPRIIFGVTDHQYLFISHEVNRIKETFGFSLKSLSTILISSISLYSMTCTNDVSVYNELNLFANANKERREAK